MSGAARFSYPLEPVRLAQQWAHDALLASLADHNARVAAQAATVAGFAAELEGAAAQYAAMTGGTNSLALDRLARLHRYAGDQAARLAQARAALADVEQERDALRDEAMASRRRLDGIERHRDRLQATFVQGVASAEFKAADDQWNSRAPGGAP